LADAFRESHGVCVVGKRRPGALGLCRFDNIPYDPAEEWSLEVLDGDEAAMIRQIVDGGCGRVELIQVREQAPQAGHVRVVLVGLRKHEA
jgi:hypothetical protein